MLPETELAWLAGIFDGEGSARIYRSKPSGRAKSPNYWAQVQAVSNTDPQIIERVVQGLEALGLQARYHIRRNNGNVGRKGSKPWWKPCSDVRVTGHRQVATYLTAILPFTTGQKKAHAEAVLAFVRLRESRPRPACKLGKPSEWNAADEAMYRQQPLARGKQTPVN